MAPWLSVIGIGEDGMSGLSPAARALMADAELLIGGERHLSMIPDDGRERIAWPTPLARLVERIAKMRGRSVAVLATGDPMLFGIGSTLARHISPAEMTILPGLSAFSLAAARLAWPLDEVATITLHGRPLETLALHVHPGARLIILAHDGSTARALAEWLTARGFGDSRVLSFAHMGGPKESREQGLARQWTARVPDFSTIAVECVAGPGARWLPRVAGLPDEAFHHDGKMTKREFRALALAKLMPHAGALLWDVGAGAGSVAIEWMRAAPHARAIALEPVAERRAFAAGNAVEFGVPGIDIRDVRAPEGLADLPPPNAVFLGGGISEHCIAASMEALRAGGRLVAHAVMLESEAALLAAYGRHGGDLVRLSVARAEPVGNFQGWRPAMPVTQWAWVKR